MSAPVRVSRLIADARAMEALGAILATACGQGAVVYLQGDLGTGKTTLVRGLLRGLGHAGPVRSPTFTLLEPYQCGGRSICHMDLYRLADPEELEYLGARDYFDERSLCLVEWPERGAGFLPPPDLRVHISYADRGRRVELTAHSEAGCRALGLT